MSIDQSDRVGGFRVNMTREERKNSIKSVLFEFQRKGRKRTRTSIARRLGLRPSTYLADVLEEMYLEGTVIIDVKKHTNGIDVFHYTIPKAEKND